MVWLLVGRWGDGAPSRLAEQGRLKAQGWPKAHSLSRRLNHLPFGQVLYCSVVLPEGSRLKAGLGS